MAATIQGSTHLYGITGGVGVVTNATVISFSLTKAHKNTAETVNEIGNEIERRYDDLHQDGTITLRPRSGFTALTIGGTYSYGGTTFEVVSEGTEEGNADFKTLTYTIKRSEYITYAP
jgi:hypothetical protein